MTTETDLDRAHAAMEAGDDADRLAFYQLLADSELILWLEDEPDGENFTPKIIESEGIAFVLAFDSEERLAELAQGAAARLSLSGRALAHMLAEQGIGLGLNMGDAPSATLLPPDAMVWLVETLGAGQITENTDRPVSFAPPDTAPSALTEALRSKLGRAAGLADCAYLSEATFSNGVSGLLLTIVGASHTDQPALRAMVREAVVFSCLNDKVLDLAFLDDDDPVLPRLRPSAYVLDMSAPKPDVETVITAPGMDKDKPPRLR